MDQLISKVKKIENDVETSFASIIQQGQSPEDKIVTLLLGPTGSGKTTLYYALTDKPLKGMKNGRKKYLDSPSPIDKFKIGHRPMAQTTIPGLEYDPGTDIIFCDCPGFFDNRGEIQDITNSFAIHRVLSHAKNVKILFITSYDDVRSARGGPFVESCNIVENLIRSRSALQPAIALIITKVPPNYLPQNPNDKLTLLDDVDPSSGWLAKVFKDSSKRDDKNVFTFPCPDANQIGNTYSGFNDRQKILDFIVNSPETHVRPFISLSDPAKLMIIDNIGCFGSLSELLSEFLRIVQVDYLESDANLDLWKERVDTFCSSTFSSPKDFVEKSKQIINPSSERYDNLYKEFIKIDDWRLFLKRIAVEEFDTEENADRCISQNSELLSAVFLDISKYLCDIMTPSHSILLDKIEKRNIDLNKKKTIEDLRRLAELNEQILKEQQKQKLLAIQRQHELEVQWLERKKQMEINRIRNSGGGGGGGGCILI